VAAKFGRDSDDILGGSMSAARFAACRRLGGSAALILLLTAPAGALEPGKPLAACTLEIWRARDGLPGPWVRAIAQTPDGYLWVATFGGLARYDGARFVPIGSLRIFPTANDIAGLAVAPDGRLWVLPSNGEPLCARGEQLERCLPPGVGLPAGARLSAILPEAEGAWIATRDEVLHLTEGRLVRLGALAGRPDQTPPALPFGRVAAFLRDAGALLLATDQGLFRLVDQGFTSQPGVPAGPVTALARSATGRPWITGPAGLARLGPGGSSSSEKPAGHVNDVIQDRDGNVWTATSKGLLRLREGRLDTFDVADGLPDENITAVFEDRQGSLWVGMRGGGLAQFTDRTLRSTDGPPMLRNELVTSLAQDDRGTVWLGSRRGLVRWQDGRERLFTTADGLPSESVNTVLPGASGELWVGTTRGLVRWVGERVDPKPLHDGSVNALYLDRSGALWIGGQGVVLRARDGHLDRFVMDPVLKGQVRALGEDDRGEVWLGAIGGVGHLKGDRFEAVPTLDSARVVTARAIHADGSGTLWFATNAGLISRAGGHFQQLSGLDPGLVGQIYQVVSDDGRLWVGTTRGLARIDPGALPGPPGQRRPPFSVLAFETSDRRRDATATGTRQPGVWRMRDGRLWFGSDQGVLTVDPRRPPMDTRAPSVVIERAILDGRDAVIGASNLLPPGPGNLEFHFAVITLVDPRRAQHRYLLEGFDRDWIDAGTRRVAQYTNIPPGRYRFRVQGSNADGVWNEAGSVVAFTLAPRFYVTAWFRALAGLSLAGLAFLLYRLRLRGLRRAYLAAFEERSRVARELHDTLLQSMSAIGMQLRGVRRRLGPAAPGAARELESVEDMVNLSLDETRRFVWNLRQQAAGSGDLGVALARLGDRLTQGRAVLAQTRVEGDVRPLPNGVQDQLFRIAQEAVANAVKHAEASRIDVTLSFEPDQVCLRIADDGRGFDPVVAQGPQAGHFGLVGMRERGRSLGDLTIDSREGGGTRIEISVPTGKKPERADE
jgi:signal transduction histidine kinase/ligand-binding sensor domain-containing protein